MQVSIFECETVRPFAHISASFFSANSMEYPCIHSNPKPSAGTQLACEQALFHVSWTDTNLELALMLPSEEIVPVCLPPRGGEAVRLQNVTGRQYWKSIIDRPGDCEAGI